MKFCESHWVALRAEVERVGLSKFVARDSREAIEKTVSSLKNAERGLEDGMASFEPLLNAHWAIVNNVMRFVGLELMLNNQDGTERCPLCFATSDHKAKCTKVDCKIENFDNWIVRAVSDQLDLAKQLGLVGES